MLKKKGEGGGKKPLWEEILMLSEAGEMGDVEHQARSVNQEVGK